MPTFYNAILSQCVLDLASLGVYNMLSLQAQRGPGQGGVAEGAHSPGAVLICGGDGALQCHSCQKEQGPR